MVLLVDARLALIMAFILDGADWNAVKARAANVAPVAVKKLRQFMPGL